MRRWILILFTTLLTTISQGQDCQKQISNDKINSLIAIYGNQKDFDSVLFIPALLALDHYPELKNAKITFKRKRLKTLMAARPDLNFVFRKKEKRSYTIFISTNEKNNSGRLIEEMSLCAQTGIIGHEFAHILSYTQKSNSKLIAFAISYPFKKKAVERETDMITIERGLGHQILDFNRHVHKSNFASKQYLRRKTRNYLSITEIENEVANSF